jgi:putative redox protein
MKTYKNDQIAVDWKPELCVHCGNCIAGLPAVFNLYVRPWIFVDGASAADIGEQVSKCPSGAISINTESP